MYKRQEENYLLREFVAHTQLDNKHASPYIAAASTSILKHFVTGFHQGITVTSPGFYGPQGRVLRLGLSNPDLIERFTGFRYGNHRITNFEMETSAMYGLGRLLGHNSLSLSAIVANRITKEFSKDGNAAVENLITKALATIVENNI